MKRNRQRLAIGAAGVAVALALAGAAVAALTTRTHTAAAAKIAVTEREYHITLSKKTVAAGTVTFAVRNTGHMAHALAVSGAGIAGVKKLATIAPGKSRTLTVKVKGGTLSVWCPMPGHAALGMKTSLKVHGAAAAGGGAGAGTTTTPVGGGGDTWA
jgi:plastocyanin